MPFFGQFRREPDADDLAHLLIRDHLAAERQHIRAIMFAAVSGRAFVVTHRRSNTRTVDHDSEITTLSRYGECDRLRDVRIIHGLHRVGAEILVVAAEFGQHALQAFFHFKAAVIRTNCDDSALLFSWHGHALNGYV